jgi:hypothetical protein
MAAAVNRLMTPSLRSESPSKMANCDSARRLLRSQQRQQQSQQQHRKQTGRRKQQAQYSRQRASRLEGPDK